MLIRKTLPEDVDTILNIFNTVRQMATDLGINTMTVSKAYQLLKTEGFLETDRRKGTTICYPTSSAPPDNRFDEKLADELELCFCA